MLKADEFCRIVGITKMSFVEFCHGKVGFVEICFNLSLIVDEICRILTNNIKESRKVLINMEKWCVEFELICDIMSKEIEKRKQIRIEMNKLYENVEKLDRMYERSENPVERGHMAAEIVEIQDKLEQLEIEYDMANYMVKRLKEERRAVLEK